MEVEDQTTRAFWVGMLDAFDRLAGAVSEANHQFDGLLVVLRASVPDPDQALSASTATNTTAAKGGALSAPVNRGNSDRKEDNVQEDQR